MSELAEILTNLNLYLEQTLHDLNNLSPSIQEALHDEDNLPSSERLEEAAKTVDLLHKIQLLLDPPTLILADHFLAVERKIPDVLQKGPLTLDQLAEATNTRGDRLVQILGILCTSGIFSFDDRSNSYSNSPASSLLHSKHWTQWHNWVTLYGDQFYDIARGIPQSVQRNVTRSAAQINFDTDMDMFEFFTQSGWLPQLHRTLGGGATAQMPGILADYPWESVSDELILDIGGGGGALVAGLLKKYPNMQGGIFDIPRVIEHVRPFFRSGGQYSDVRHQVADENLIGGDFFESVPKCTIYIMKWCLHDWKDPETISILRRIRENIIMSPKSRLIVMESVLSDEHSARLSQYGNINMMMTANGNERTEKQYRELAKLSGWRIERIYNLRRAWVKAMEFRPVDNERE